MDYWPEMGDLNQGSEDAKQQKGDRGRGAGGVRIGLILPENDCAMVNGRETNRFVEQQDYATPELRSAGSLFGTVASGLCVTQCRGLTTGAKSVIIEARNVSTRKWQRGIAASRTQAIECSGQYHNDNDWI